MTCGVDGCLKLSKARGMCPSHYNKWSRYGDPVAGKFLKDGRGKEGAHGSWKSMMARCGHSEKYRALGFDPEWADYTVFARDMGERPPGTSLDRIDNAKGYSRANCRWATRHQQAANRSDNNPTVGVGLSRGKYWVARIQIARRYIHLGSFATETEAAEARREGERRYLKWAS